MRRQLGHNLQPWREAPLSEHLPPKETFSLVAALALFIALLGFWKPRSVFSHTYDKPQARGTDFVGEVKRLVKHRAIYPAVLINFLWNFAPGAATPLQFYLTNKLHASDAVYSYYNGIFAASFVPTFLLFGFLCKRVPLKQAALVGKNTPWLHLHLFIASPRCRHCVSTTVPEPVGRRANGQGEDGLASRQPR